ncbi:caspase family protein [Streptomyces sp. NPDC048171]|uniref:caspase, EACC1-associated type n=1 Tax=Streptomyces sp. NPDC048171 TaxID=3365504 RepID=UPI00371D3EE6
MTPSTDPLGPGSRAVLIGAWSGCDDLGLADLPAVERNIAELHRLLTVGGVAGLRPDHCVRVEQPSHPHEILRPVEHAASQTTDTLLIYYAGHGLLEGRRQRDLYLALCGTRWPDECLPYESLRTRILECGKDALQTVVILDCCFSGQALDGEMSGEGIVSPGQLPDVVARETRLPGACVLTASAATRKALAPVGATYTAFTGELIAVLRDGIAGGPELLDMSTLYTELTHRMRRRAPAPTPRFGSRGTGARTVLTRNRAYAPPPSGATVHAASAPSARPRPHDLVALADRLFGEADHEAAALNYRKALVLFEAEQNRPAQINVLIALARVAQATGDLPGSSAHLDHARAMAVVIGNRLAEMNALNGLGSAALAGDATEIAIRHHRAALMIAEEIGNDLGLLNALNGLARAAVSQTDLDTAVGHYRRALALAERLSSDIGRANAHIGLGNIARRRDDRPTAERHFLQALAGAKAVDNRPAQATILRTLGDLTGSTQYYTQAAALTDGTPAGR